MAEIPISTTDYAAPKGERPIGVIIIAILFIGGAIVNLAFISSSFGFYGLGSYGLLYIGYTTLMSVINLIIGIALFQLISWSRMAAIIMQIIGLLGGVVSTVTIGGFMGGPYSSFLVISMLPSIIYSLIVIIYLMQGSVKAAFEGTQW